VGFGASLTSVPAPLAMSSQAAPIDCYARHKSASSARRQVPAREPVFEHSPIDVALCDLRVGVKVIRTQSEQSSSGYPWELTFSMK
jgi:hypothetical protein